MGRLAGFTIGCKSAVFRFGAIFARVDKVCLGPIQKIITPTFCTVCGTIGPTLCENCSKKIKPITFQQCIVCENPSVHGKTHRACLKYSRIISLTCPFIYIGPVKKIILQSKEGNRSYTLLDLLFHNPINQSLIRTLPKVDLIIPVPSSTEKKRLVNHAAYIANQIDEKKTCNILKKTTKVQQKALTLQERWKTKSQFKINGKYKSIVKNAKILLVDDVITTGATFSGCADTLHEMGAKRIYCYCLAKDLRLRYNVHNNL